VPTPAKEAAVAELATAFRESSGAVLAEYRGLTVAQLAELRRALADDGRFAVVKNTLTRLAAREAGLALLEPLLEGPSAVAFVTGDPVAVAKSMREFARAHPALVVKGGVLEGRSLNPDELRRLADLQSREVLLAQLVGAMQASLARAAGLFAAPLSQLARLAAALADQRAAAGEPAEGRAEATAPSAEEPAEEPPDATGSAADATPAAAADATSAAADTAAGPDGPKTPEVPETREAPAQTPAQTPATTDTEPAAPPEAAAPDESAQA
jgi:large subunit ribosomal protein L10